MNFQNVPRTDKTIKAAFKPKLDAFGFWDYSSIEMVLLAFYLASIGDTSMAQEIRDGLDPHRETALKVLGRCDTDEHRQSGKTLNFSMVYAGGAPTLMRQLGLTFPEACNLRDSFRQARPGLTALENGIRQVYHSRGYIKTLWGRHLHPESDHKALNALIQGCAADLMRQALRTVSTGLRAEGMTSHLVSVVHDELILDCVEDELARLYHLMPVWMDWELISQVVPVTTEMEVSRTTWADKALWTPEGSTT